MPTKRYDRRLLNKSCLRSNLYTKTTLAGRTSTKFVLPLSYLTNLHVVSRQNPSADTDIANYARANVMDLIQAAQTSVFCPSDR